MERYIKNGLLFPILIASPPVFGTLNTLKDVCSILKKIEELVPSIAQYPKLHYPNESYQEIPINKKGKVFIVGYGSLMKKKSIGVSGTQTIKNSSSETIRPIVAFGLKRMYNYKEQKPENKDPIKYARQKDELAYLNVMPSAAQGSFMNAVVMEIDLEDLAELIKREKGYDLIPVVFVDWDRLLNNRKELRFEVGYTFAASSEKRQTAFNAEEEIHYTDDNIYPIRRYADYVKQAADDFGPLFSQMYDKTTYLADGKTHICQWNRTCTSDTNEYVREYEKLRKFLMSIEL